MSYWPVHACIFVAPYLGVRSYEQVSFLQQWELWSLLEQSVAHHTLQQQLPQ